MITSPKLASRNVNAKARLAPYWREPNNIAKTASPNAKPKRVGSMYRRRR
jgi:hypothetical protein